MRTIKFRAWDKEENMMIVPFTLIDLNNGEFLAKHELERMELMQFTGLLDKNGKEIYEGDIIQGNKEFPPFVVEWNHELLGWSINKSIESFCEIVGNIYENPNLLK